MLLAVIGGSRRSSPGLRARQQQLLRRPIVAAAAAAAAHPLQPLLLASSSSLSSSSSSLLSINRRQQLSTNTRGILHHHAARSYTIVQGNNLLRRTTGTTERDEFRFFRSGRYGCGCGRWGGGSARSGFATRGFGGGGDDADADADRRQRRVGDEIHIGQEAAAAATADATTTTEMMQHRDSDDSTTARAQGAHHRSRRRIDLNVPTHLLYQMSYPELESYVVDVEESSTLDWSDADAYQAANAANNLQTYIFELMKACAALHTTDGAKLCERLLGHVLVCSDSSSSGSSGGGSGSRPPPPPPPSHEMFNVTIDAWAGVGGNDNAGRRRDQGGSYGARRAEQVLDLMWDEWRRAGAGAGANGDDDDDANSNNCSSNGNAELVARPNAVNYSAVMKAWARSGDGSAPRKVTEDLLRTMEDESGLADLLRAAADAAAVAAPTRDDDGSPSAVHGQRNFVVRDPDLVPDRICYNTAISAWSRLSDSDARAPNEIIKLMRHMERVSHVLQDENIRPNTVTYNTLIHSYARVGSGGGKGRGRGNRGGGGGGRRRSDDPSSSSASASPSPQESVALAAEAVLREMHELYMTSEEGGARKVDGQHEENDYDYDDENENDNTVRPNISSYNGVLNAWSNVRTEKGPHRAEEILRAMLLEGGGVVSDADESGGRLPLPVMDDIEPNIVTYNTIVNSWAKSGLPESGERAEAILNHMHGFIGKNFLFHPVTKTVRGKVGVDVRPNAITYNATMNAHAKSGSENGPARAERLLRRMLDHPPGDDDTGPIEPNAVSFTTCIFVWGRSTDPEGAERAESLLDLMEGLWHETRDTKLRPSGSCYGGVIFAWANRGRADRAEAALVRMRTVGDIQPLTSYSNAVLEALAKESSSSSEQAAAANANVAAVEEEGEGEEDAGSIVKRAYSILDGMIAAGNENNNAARPDLASFHHVIVACGNGSRHGPAKRREAFFTAVDTFNRLRDSSCCRGDEKTYAIVLGTIIKLLPNRSKERTEVCERLFKLCCNDGLLSNATLHLLRNAVPRWSLQNMLGLDQNSTDRRLSLNVRQLPNEWSRNVGGAAR